MIKLLNKIFKDKDVADQYPGDILEILCGLMIEAANSDGKIDNKELEKIKLVLVDIFKEDRKNVDIILKKSIDNKNNSKSLYYYTSKINKNFSDKKKILLIETLWEIVLSDGELHDYESSLIRRLSGLLYISDVNSGNARKRALNKILSN